MNTIATWKIPDTLPGLGPEDVHIWRIALDAKHAGAANAVLSDEEQARSERMLEVPRIRFICARAALRNILAAYLARPPRALALIAGEHGKLHLPDHALHFNLSHAGDFALMAVCRHAELGVDIEKVDEARALRDIASRFFSSAEQVALASLSGNAYIRGFFRCWSRKEAVIKALGEGLACPLGLFDVSLDERQAALLAFRRSNVDASRWTMAHITAHPDYEAALAVIGPIAGLSGFEYNPRARYFAGKP